jgi:hypothetical protein
MENLKLIYVLPVGENWKGEFIYEFLFSDDIRNVDGEDWDVYPASNKPSPPYKDLIKCVGRLVSDFKFDVIQESDTFAVWDAVDDIVALAWENLDDYDEYPENRMCFKFGEAIDSVKDKLYSKDLILKLKNIKNEVDKE